MQLIPGNALSFKAQQHVLAAFIHRHLDTTCSSDQEWLERRAFYIRKDGCLALKPNHCEPAWMVGGAK